jgi:hypothetical protein
VRYYLVYLARICGAGPEWVKSRSERTIYIISILYFDRILVTTKYDASTCCMLISSPKQTERHFRASAYGGLAKYRR